MKAYKWFKGCETISQAKALWHELMLKHHPDRGGDTETAQAINDEFDNYCSDFVHSAYSQYAESKGWTDYEQTASWKADTIGAMLARVCKMNVTVELVGSWIWVSDCWTDELKQTLSDMGFWYSGRHQVYIFTGKKKRQSKKYMTTDHVKMINGVETIRTREEEPELTAIA